VSFARRSVPWACCFDAGATERRIWDFAVEVLSRVLVADRMDAQVVPPSVDRSTSTTIDSPAARAVLSWTHASSMILSDSSMEPNAPDITTFAVATADCSARNVPRRAFSLRTLSPFKGKRRFSDINLLIRTPSGSPLAKTH
jgi:hypothetical protein